MATVKRKHRAANETTLRHAWLAGLGLIVVARRETLAARGRLIGNARVLRQRARGLVVNAGQRVRGEVEPRVVQFSAEVESRLAPVLDKLGLKSQVRRPVRKAPKVAKKPQARRAARKPARHPGRKG